MNTLGSFIDAWELFRDPCLAGATAGALLGGLGCYIALRRLVFLSAAMTQSAGLGVMGAHLAQAQTSAPAWLASPTLWGLGMALLGATALGGNERTALGRDQRLGLMYLLGAAGSVLIGAKVTLDAHDVDTILFGSAVAVSPEDLTLLLGVAAVLLTLHAVTWRGLVAATFDRDAAQVRGLPVRALELSLLVGLALAVAVCTRTVGALPVFAFSTLPAIAASRSVANLGRTLVLATLLGATAGFSGYVLAFLFDLPVGASQSVVSLAMVGAAEAFRVARSRF